MQLRSLRVRNFRTIGQTDIEIPLDRNLTVVGANNSGKTNILNSVSMLFTGHDNELAYTRSRDLTFGSTNKTSFLAVFAGDDSTESPDRTIYELFDKLNALYGRAREGAAFSLSLVFSPSDVPTYQFFPNTKKPTDGASQAAISRIQRQLVGELLNQFSCHYIPSAKSIEQLYNEVLNPFLRTIAARAVSSQIDGLVSALQHVSQSINSELGDAGLVGYHASFGLPHGGLERLLREFEFNMKDPAETPITRKGQGIQSTALFAALRWVSTEEAKLGKSSIWLVEEPEAYLHPQLMGSVRRILTRLSEVATVVVSTHSISFVPTDPREILGVRLDASGRTETSSFRSYREATQSIRSALGVRFSDYYQLEDFNLAVEGPTDKELIRWALATLTKADTQLDYSPLTTANIIDFGGVKNLAGWLRATYEIVHRERALVSVFDGDSAGEKERRDLNGYFGNMKVPWQANQDYLVVRPGFAVEGLFPDEWLIDLHTEHESWFDDFPVDVQGALVSFSIRDSRKRQVIDSLKSRAEAESNSDWSSRWRSFLTAAQDALTRQQKRLSNDSPTEGGREGGEGLPDQADRAAEQ